MKTLAKGEKVKTVFNDKNIMVVKASVKRHWYNSFAQNCYELEDGTTIHIDYSNDEISIEMPKNGTLNNVIKFNNGKDN